MSSASRKYFKNLLLLHVTIFFFLDMNLFHRPSFLSLQRYWICRSEKVSVLNPDMPEFFIVFQNNAKFLY